MRGVIESTLVLNTTLTAVRGKARSYVVNCYKLSGALSASIRVEGDHRIFLMHHTYRVMMNLPYYRKVNMLYEKDGITWNVPTAGCLIKDFFNIPTKNEHQRLQRKTRVPGMGADAKTKKSQRRKTE